MSDDGRSCVCGDRAKLNEDGKSCYCEQPLTMAESFNCIDVPDYVGSLSDCGGEYIGDTKYEGLTKTLSVGGCFSPDFLIIEKDKLPPGSRYIFIDEI